MPYKVSLTRKGGRRIDLAEVHRLKTPWKDEQATVEVDGQPVRAIVTNVRKSLSKSPGTAIETVDDVDALEA
jgi:hypothetical protein